MHVILPRSLVCLFHDIFVYLLLNLKKKYDKCAFNITLERKKIINFQTNCKEKLNKYKFSIDDKIIILDCKHIFHRRCIKHWLLQEKVTCPVCRKDVREMIK